MHSNSYNSTISASWRTHNDGENSPEWWRPRLQQTSIGCRSESRISLRALTTVSSETELTALLRCCPRCSNSMLLSARKSKLPSKNEIGKQMSCLVYAVRACYHGREGEYLSTSSPTYSSVFIKRTDNKTYRYSVLRSLSNSTACSCIVLLTIAMMAPLGRDRGRCAA